MIDLPFDQIPVACGWPWHGLVRRDPAAAIWNIALPNGGTYSFKSNRFVESDCSFVFDMGLPDLASPELEAAGGAWWGRALLRGDIPGPLNTRGDSAVALPELHYGIGFSPEIGASRNLWGVPLVMRRDDAAPFRVFCRAFIRGGVLNVRILNGRQEYSIARPLALADIGQGSGQPDAAAYHLNGLIGSYFAGEITSQYPGKLKAFVRDFRENKLLLGVVAASEPGSPIAGVPLSQQSTRAPGVWRDSLFPLFGLLEVEVLPSIFDEGVAPDDAVLLRVIEDRNSALGSPVFETGNTTPPGGGRNYFARWTQTRGLLNAFYDASGIVKTIRYSRVQESTLHKRRLQGDGDSLYWRQDTGRSTTFQLYGIDESQVDEFTLAENLTEIERGSSVRVIRTVNATGDEPEVLDSGEVSGTAVWADPLEVYKPGFHNFVACISQFYKVAGVDIIPSQDIRVAWVIPYGNRMGCLAFTREPYETTAGKPVRIQMRKIAAQSGVIDDVLSAIEAKPSFFPNVRSLFLFNGRLLGSFNPVTGQHTRTGGTWV